MKKTGKKETRRRIGMFGLFAMLALVFSLGLVSAYRGSVTAEKQNYDADRHEAMEAAFEAGDYDSWYALMTEDGRHPRAVDVIDADNFADFAELHEAIEGGDDDKAAEIRAELGLGSRMMDGSGFHGACGRMGRAHEGVAGATGERMHGCGCMS